MEASEREPKHVAIEVSGPDLTIGPTGAHVSPKQEVVWTAGKGVISFLLVFEENKPFNRVEVRSKAEGDCVRARATAVHPGIFHYQVIVLAGDPDAPGRGGHLVAETACPTVIVE